MTVVESISKPLIYSSVKNANKRFARKLRKTLGVCCRKPQVDLLSNLGTKDKTSKTGPPGSKPHFFSTKPVRPTVFQPTKKAPRINEEPYASPNKLPTYQTSSFAFHAIFPLRLFLTTRQTQPTLQSLWRQHCNDALVLPCRHP